MKRKTSHPEEGEERSTSCKGAEEGSARSDCLMTWITNSFDSRLSAGEVTTRISVWSNMEEVKCEGKKRGGTEVRYVLLLRGK